MLQVVLSVMQQAIELTRVMGDDVPTKRIASSREGFAKYFADGLAHIGAPAELPEVPEVPEMAVLPFEAIAAQATQLFFRGAVMSGQQRPVSSTE